MTTNLHSGAISQWLTLHNLHLAIQKGQLALLMGPILYIFSNTLKRHPHAHNLIFLCSVFTEPVKSWIWQITEQGRWHRRLRSPHAPPWAAPLPRGTTTGSAPLWLEVGSETSAYKQWCLQSHSFFALIYFLWMKPDSFIVITDNSGGGYHCYLTARSWVWIPFAWSLHGSPLPPTVQKHAWF